jgi:hypothetical protein
LGVVGVGRGLRGVDRIRIREWELNCFCAAESVVVGCGCHSYLRGDPDEKWDG